MKSIVHLLATLGCLMAPPLSAADDIIQPLGNERLPKTHQFQTPSGMNVERRIRNEHAAFCVRVEVYVVDGQGRVIPSKDRVFVEGQCMEVRVRSEKDGFLYLLYKQADGSETCLFPNKFHANNRIQAKKKIRIPGPDANFRLRAAPPFGRELLVALVSTGPLDTERFFGRQSLTADVATPVDFEKVIEGIKGFVVEGDQQPATFAEHAIEITTRPKRPQHGQQNTQKKRIGLFIGIDKYSAGPHLSLKGCANDAKSMADVMCEMGGLDAVGTLLDEQATRRNIAEAFYALRKKSRPGDEVIVYWSGHGATCADAEGDEADGVDEFLLPHDFDQEDVRQTAVMDDVFGRWIQDLDGRRVVVILDACFSGGHFGGRGDRRFAKGK